MSAHRGQVAAALDAVAIEGVRYRWLGRLSRPLPPRLRERLDAPQRRHLRDTLREELYASFYCRGAVTPARVGEDQPVRPDPRLVSALAAADAGGDAWQVGWTVERIDGDRAVVRSARLRARVATEACRQCSGALAAGTPVSLPATRQRPALSPGFFTIVGDAGDVGAGGLVRVYWHLAPAGGPPLVRALTSALNRGGTRFRLKVLDHPLRFARCDAAVLYLPADDLPPLRARLTSIAADLERFLRPAVPAFTHRLAAGVGVSECDGSSESFGVRRCGLLADAVLAAHEAGATARQARAASTSTRRVSR